MPEQPKGDNYDFVHAHRHDLIEATHIPSGIRSCFYAAEHVNIGRGWMMMDRDHKISGVVSEKDLADLKAVKELL